MASDNNRKNNDQAGTYPPNKYQLNEVEIKLTRHAGAIKGSTAKKVIISGNGSAVIESNGKKISIDYSSQDVLALINSFYNIRFFDLPTHYNISYSVFLNNGSLNTKALKMADSLSTSVCYSLSAFKKCVTYSKEQPYELEKLVQAVFHQVELN
jgi:hypothetical protein